MYFKVYKKRILLISDKKNWSYDAIAQSLIKFNSSDDLILSHVSCKRNIDKIARIKKKYDFYFVLGWQNAVALPFLDKKRTLIGVHSHQSFDDRRTTPGHNVIASSKFVRYLSQFKSVNTVSARLKNVLNKSGIKATYTPNGVDVSVFCPKERVSSKLIACCVAAPKNDWNKGVNDIIMPACKRAGVKLICSSTNKTHNSNMESFYNKSHVYICASKSEGMPMSILEAAACGCVVISTRCGDIVRLVDNKSGFLVERSITAIAEKLVRCKDIVRWKKMSDSIRYNIESKWRWEINAPKWLGFIRSSI